MGRPSLSLTGKGGPIILLGGGGDYHLYTDQKSSAGR